MTNDDAVQEINFLRHQLDDLADQIRRTLSATSTKCIVDALSEIERLQCQRLSILRADDERDLDVWLPRKP